MSFRLPRRAAWAVARVLLSIVVASAALIRIQPVTAAPPPAVAPSGDASAAASSLTQRILGDNPDDAANAVSEVFAWTGLATRDGVSEVRSAVAPDDSGLRADERGPRARGRRLAARQR